MKKMLFLGLFCSNLAYLHYLHVLKKKILKGMLTLNVAVNFDGNRFISYSHNPYVGLDGVKTYTKGDLSATWTQIGKKKI